MSLCVARSSLSLPLLPPLTHPSPPFRSHDPLRQPDSKPTESPRPAPSASTSPSPRAEPFSAGWDSPATEAWGDTAVERGADAQERVQDEQHARHGQRGAHSDQPLAGPPPTTSSPPSTSTSTSTAAAEHRPERATFSFNPSASTFTPSLTPRAAQEPTLEPISMPAEVRASSRNRSSSGASTLNVATSATPRGIPSPLAHRQSLDPADEPPRSPSPPPAPSPPRRAPSSRSPSTVSSSRGYDPTTLRNLIASSCVNGDLERLQSLMAPRPADDGEPDPPSTFTLANQTGSHSGLAPLHHAAQKGHVEVVKWLIEQAGAMPELEDAEGEVRRSLTSPSLLPLSIFETDEEPFRARRRRCTRLPIEATSTCAGSSSRATSTSTRPTTTAGLPCTTPPRAARSTSRASSSTPAPRSTRRASTATRPS